MITTLQVDEIVNKFLTDKEAFLRKLCIKAFGDNDKLSFNAFSALISKELNNACISFINKNNDVNNLTPYLMTSSLVFATSLNDSKNTNKAYICPCCKFYNEYSILAVNGKKLHCSVCALEISSSLNQFKIHLCKAFMDHSKGGFKCKTCERFIPASITKNTVVSCPFPDCSFVGSVDMLGKMAHPSVKINLENLQSDETVINNYSETNISELEIKENIVSHLNILQKTISSQLNFIPQSHTYKQKLCMYKAFQAIIDRYPEQMIKYLVYGHKRCNMQHIIFQEFISILENEIPFNFTKGKTQYTVTSLLDENLCIFDGESSFESTVNEFNEINNETEELYVGSRKGRYCEKYYIGKILDIINLNTNQSILQEIDSYSFFKINMNKSIPISTPVLVKHLRIPPHYQMGGMVYLNRIKTKIINKVKTQING